MLPKEIDSGDGRRFALRATSPADMLDLIEVAGAAASSAAWLRYALMICSVSAIDGTPVLMPLTKNALRDLGRRIGNVGMDALAAAHYPDGATDGLEPTSLLDVAKKLSRHPLLTQVVYLMRNGVPWTQVMAMSAERRLACCVALGEIDGGIFDWSSLQWAVLPKK